MRSINFEVESWPIAGRFRISRSSLTAIDVVVVTVSESGHMGRGECRPYARYSETPKSVMAQLAAVVPNIDNLEIETLSAAMPAGAARNALDCALWDLRAQKLGKPVHSQLTLPSPQPRQTAFTLSIDTPQAMQEAAIKAKDHKILKLKIGNAKGLNACKAVLEARPDAELIIDANEALSPGDCIEFCNALKSLPVIMIEQPVKAGTPLPKRNCAALPLLCADESLHTREDLGALWDAGYRAVNIKLDKAGGLTEGLALAREAKQRGFVIMLGCMVGTSLAMAPAALLESYANVIDLDGALLLAKDRNPGIDYQDGQILPPPHGLWGWPR